VALEVVGNGNTKYDTSCLSLSSLARSFCFVSLRSASLRHWHTNLHYYIFIQVSFGVIISFGKHGVFNNFCWNTTDFFYFIRYFFLRSFLFGTYCILFNVVFHAGCFDSDWGGLRSFSRSFYNPLPSSYHHHHDYTYKISLSFV